MLVHFVHILLIIGIVYRSYVKNRRNELSHFFLPALFLKLIAGVGVGLLYLFYYRYGDTLLYFDDAQILCNLFFKNWKSYFLFIADQFDVPLHYVDNPRALFFVKLISPIVILTNKSYWLTSIYLSLFSFYTGWYLVLNVQKYYPKSLMGAVVGLLFFPSIVFWSSGMLKESVSAFSLFLLAAYFLQLINDEEFRWRKILLIILLLLLLLNLKYYYLAAFLLAISPTLVLKFIEWRIRIRHPLFLWGILLLLVGLGVSLLHPNLSAYRFVNIIVENNRLYESHADLATTINYYQLNSSFWSILLNAPIALFSILFRPLLFETRSWLQVALAMENAVLAVLIITWFYKKSTFKITPLLMSILVYILILGVFLALSTPNFGSLSRYRISFLPFLIILISYKSPIFTWLDKLNSKYLTRKS